MSHPIGDIYGHFISKHTIEWRRKAFCFIIKSLSDAFNPVHKYCCLVEAYLVQTYIFELASDVKREEILEAPCVPIIVFGVNCNVI